MGLKEVVKLGAGVVGDPLKDLWAGEVGCCDCVGVLTCMVVLFPSPVLKTWVQQLGIHMSRVGLLLQSRGRGIAQY